MKRLFLALSIAVSTWSCSDDNESPQPTAPEACFTAPEGLTALTSFTLDASCSKNASTYRWSFGDGNTSTEASPTHSYNAQGNYNIKLVVTGTGNTKDSTTVSVVVGPVPSSKITSHYFDIEKDEVWESGIHKVMSSIGVMNATLTIKPGVIVMFEEDASITIGNNTFGDTGPATLIAEGTASQPIQFTAAVTTPEVGYNFGVNFGEFDTGNSSMKYCTMEYAGGSYGESALVTIRKTSVTLENNIFRHSSNYGVSVLDDGSFKSFKNNTFDDIPKYALQITPNAVTSIGQPNNYGANYILVNGTLNVPSASWKKLEVPYVVSAELSIGSETGTTLTLQPGVTFRMDFGIVTIGEYGAKGKLIAEGTASDPILFTSHDPNPAAKDWGGLLFMSGNDSTSSLKYCTLEYGGTDFDNWKALIRVEWTSLNVNNCTIRHASPYAVWCNEAGHFQSFENNVIDNAEGDGIFINSNYVNTIGLSNTITAKKELTVDGTVVKSATWEKRAYPYSVIDWFGVGSDAGAILTLKPGVKIEFARAYSFGMGRYDKGGLIADGTAEDPIVFTSISDTPAPSDWEYIYMGANTMPGTILNHCIIEFGGFNSSVGNLWIEDTNVPTISNCTIRNSGSYGLSLKNANPSISNITYENNANTDQINL